MSVNNSRPTLSMISAPTCATRPLHNKCRLDVQDKWRLNVHRCGFVSYFFSPPSSRTSVLHTVNGPGSFCQSHRLFFPKFLGKGPDSNWALRHESWLNTSGIRSQLWSLQIFENVVHWYLHRAWSEQIYRYLYMLSETRNTHVFWWSIRESLAALIRSPNRHKKCVSIANTYSGSR